MDTIQTYQSDSSAMGRINAWHYAFNAANDNFLGMGFDAWSLKTFAIYAPDPSNYHVAHSIYFSVLGDHGWFGLLLFLIIYFLVWFKLSKVIKITNDSPELKNYNFLAKMFQVILIAYFVGGAFLSLSYFDLPWHIISFIVLLDEFSKQQKQLQVTT
jgi:putative inorganic carbon (hco3(-)) transporter